jgi:hypothetical protein
MNMARGWESKAVEAQIEQAAQAAQATAQAVASPEAIEHKHKLDGLRLVRSRLTEQLKRAPTVTQRQMLHQQLRVIEVEIAQLATEP